MTTGPGTGRIHSRDLSTGVDGPGTRFVLFAGGCPLRCPCRANPDTRHMRETAALLRRGKETGPHTAVDTSGFLGARATDGLLADTDLVLLAIKSFDLAAHRRPTGGERAPTPLAAPTLWNGRTSTR